eukprot:94736-Alexandrium_andersonii.AAC.1
MGALSISPPVMGTHTRKHALHEGVLTGKQACTNTCMHTPAHEDASRTCVRASVRASIGIC